MGKKMETVIEFTFLGSKITADSDYSHEIKRFLLLGRKAIKNLDITLPTKVHLVKAMVFPVVMYVCESWTAPKNWCFWTVVLEKALECPLDCKEIKPVNSKGNQPWIFIGRTDAEAKAPILWSNSHIHTRLLEKWQFWLDGHLLAKLCFCFLVCCLGL